MRFIMRIVQRIIILLVIVFVIIDSGYAQSVNNGKCSPSHFQCANEQCIDSTLLCDGIANCIDLSDESTTICEQLQCPSYAFRCDYGACINYDGLCNGIRDCVDNSDETQPQCIKNTPTRFPNNCQKLEFQCNNGQCISDYDVCDGVANCRDNSDEIVGVCRFVNCNLPYFQCAYGACIDGDLKCDGQINCVDGSDEGSTLCRSKWSSSETRPAINTTQTSIPTAVHPSPYSSTSCRIPPQPENGSWKLHSSQCQAEDNCNIPQRTTELGLGSRLIYSCNSGYKITNGLVDVTCGFGGQWVNIPVCKEIRCAPLNSPSITVICKYNEEHIPCRFPLLPMTTAEVECANGYHLENNLILKQNVICNTNGQWMPDVIKCVPGLHSINIYIKDTKFKFQTTFDRNNPALIEILDDRIIIHTNANNTN